ncbi:MAG: DNA polymerase III subunit gamma/tau [Vicinamibacteria bacterium]|nr:DNA polymerase III subunit gamma/tau [Vicinamibacteria bacterium]
MSYRALALKYRPRTFAEIVGQETVVRTLQNALRSGRIGHAFLLTGTRGVGKTTSARILAKALNCSRADGPTPEPCLECASCTEIAAGNSLDVQEIDGASNNGVENVRELRESARYNPSRDRFKVWVIDEVHMLSTAAFNALLKTLEEPPPRVKFIFATTDYHKVPDTILSRCQQYDFKQLSTRQLHDHLRHVAKEEQIAISELALGRVARAAEGSVRDALSLFDQVLAYSGSEVKDEDLATLLGLVDRELLTGASRAVLESDAATLLRLVDSLAVAGADYRTYCRELLLHFRELLLLKVAPGDEALLQELTAEERAAISPIADAFSEDDLLRALDLLGRSELELRNATDPRVALELVLLKLATLRRLLPLAELLARAERLDGFQRRDEPGAGPMGATSRTAAPPPPSPHGAATPRPTPAAVAPAPRPAPAPASRPTPAAAAAAAPAPARRGAAAPASPPVDVPALPADAPAEDVLQALKAAASARPSLSTPLKGATARLEGGALVLEPDADYAAFVSSHAADYEELLRRAGARLKLRVEARAGATAEATPQQKKREELMQEAAADPAVQVTLDLFGGRVVDVREASDQEKVK